MKDFDSRDTLQGKNGGARTSHNLFRRKSLPRLLEHVAQVLRNNTDHRGQAGTRACKLK